MAHLVIRDQHGKVLQKVILSKPVLIGRSHTCGIVVKNTLASREHCELKPSGDGWVICDLESRNRTYVNGKAVCDRVVLHDGDIIEVGQDRITFFAAASRAIRAVDPLSAGLVDAEQTVQRGSRTPRLVAAGPSESSLYATRVIADHALSADESTITGVQSSAQPSIPPEKPLAAGSTLTPSKKIRARWPAAAVAGIILILLFVMWLHFRG